MARAATGDGAGLPRRPAAASGRVSTAMTSWRGESISRRNDGRAGSGVPAKTIRMPLLWHLIELALLHPGHPATNIHGMVVVSRLTVATASL